MKPANDVDRFKLVTSYNKEIANLEQTIFTQFGDRRFADIDDLFGLEQLKANHPTMEPTRATLLRTSCASELATLLKAFTRSDKQELPMHEHTWTTEKTVKGFMRSRKIPVPHSMDVLQIPRFSWYDNDFFMLTPGGLAEDRWLPDPSDYDERTEQRQSAYRESIYDMHIDGVIAALERS